MRRLLILAIVLIVPTAFAQGKKKLNPGVYAHFATSMGDFTVELYEKQAPKTVANFIGLAQGTKEYTNPQTRETNKGTPEKPGKPYYDGVIFHRVIEGFMIQSGDPTGTGTGGPGYTIQDEIVRELNYDGEGRLAMANTGRPNSGAAQFFITVAAYPSLNGGYTVFGQVVDGMDVVQKISKVPKSPSAERSRPVTDVVLKKITIERVK